MSKYQEALNLIKAYLELAEVHENYTNSSVKSLQELVDKATPMKPTHFYYKGKLANFHCPKCYEAMGLYIQDFIPRYKAYCRCCGQAIDWSEDD